MPSPRGCAWVLGMDLATQNPWFPIPLMRKVWQSILRDKVAGVIYLEMPHATAEGATTWATEYIPARELSCVHFSACLDVRSVIAFKPPPLVVHYPIMHSLPIFASDAFKTIRTDNHDVLQGQDTVGARLEEGHGHAGLGRSQLSQQQRAGVIVADIVPVEKPFEPIFESNSLMEPVMLLQGIVAPPPSPPLFG
ncbi:hypothetical protein CSHISOI_05468 [Colletotrichum shisoi]|uniref:Uncharacterized protein n=1 Tax=Colletotrichum shisoi TaxID=2078593 RepID=A0A5Q4BJ40_9PEZI|nr:hypothetical protein CSHISOI_05468 [Colletotrichum shisoi]